MKIVLLNVEQAQSIYRSQMVRDFPESELKPFASVQGMMTRGLYEPLAFYDEAGALMAYAWQAVLPQCRNVLLDYFAVLPQYRGSGVGTAVLKELACELMHILHCGNWYQIYCLSFLFSSHSSLNRS